MHVLKYTLFILFVFGVSHIYTQPANATDNTETTSQSSAQMRGKALRNVFSETMMIGEYRDYRGVTKTFNYTEFHTGNGTTAYKEGDKHESGIWKIIGDDKVCYQYPKSEYYTRTYCFVVFEQDGCFYKFSPYNYNIKTKQPRNWERWESRAVRKGTGKSCAAPIG